MAVSLARGF